jgi:tRNA-Thr(GGU) m(6)t(6)A37 methyltransferase TsaA
LLEIHPIGVVRSPFARAAGTPIQPRFADGAHGTVVVKPEYEAALADIEGFERVLLLTWMDRASPFRPRVVPYRDTREHGLFATRSPSRPNPIGLSVVRLLERDGRVLHVSEIDVLDETPLIDIKPYVPEFDAYPSSRAGWLADTRVECHTADARFETAADAEADKAVGKMKKS